MKLVSWDAHNINDGTNYESILEAGVYGLTAIDPALGLRQGAWPLIAGVGRPGKMIHIDIYIRNTPLATYQKQLAQWFDPDDETPKKLIGEDVGGANDRYIWGICVELAEVPFSAGLHFVASVQVHGDIFWREITPTAASAWNITATGQTKVIANNGEMDCYPILKIKPTSNKTGSWPYKRFVVIKWQAGVAIKYPIDIVNNLLDTQIASTNFALANGNDLRVWIDGFETDRWLDGPNTATTQVWINMDFQADIPMTLYAGIGAGDTTITVNESINNMPASGIVRIDSETITYASKNNAAKTFNNCSRGAKESAAASHAASTIIYWLQHDLWVLYGNSGAGSPPATVTKKPLFLLSSSNTSWIYENFFAVSNPNRTAKWKKIYTGGSPVFYGGNQGGSADPYAEIGIYNDNPSDQADWRVTNVCGITNANFTNGEKRESGGAYWSARIVSEAGGVEYWIPVPSAVDTWESWSRNEAITAPSTWVGIRFANLEVVDRWLECSDVTLTLDSGNTPHSVIGSEVGNYSLDCVITNQITGESIELIFTMSLDKQLEMDTDNKTVIYLDDNSNQFQALIISGGPRRDWLKLQPGNNTLKFDDTGTVAVTIDITHEERSYH